MLKLKHKKSDTNYDTIVSKLMSDMVRVARLELTASWTPFKRATTCATPGYLSYFTTKKSFVKVFEANILNSAELLPLKQVKAIILKRLKKNGIFGWQNLTCVIKF